MNNSLRKKLLVAFLGVALVSLLTIILLVNMAVNYSFSKYLIQQSQTGIIDPEINFFESVNNLLWIAMVTVLLGVFLFSRYIAKGISTPLDRIKQAALEMTKGDLSQRVKISTNNDEISEVGKALNQFAESLQKQDQLRKNLTSDIAHELRTPLATIQSHIEAFQDGIWEPTPDKLQICHDQVMQLVQLINDLEHLADIENPMLKLKKKKIDLRQIISDAIQSVKGLWKGKQVSIQFDDSTVVFLTGDENRLKQVFINLLSNAFKFTPENGRITISIYEAENQIRVEVSDTGIGITPEEMPYIFERFFRGEKSRNRKTGGAGIGLAIVKAIVEAHLGSVSVESKLNIGTKFIVCLPK